MIIDRFPEKKEFVELSNNCNVIPVCKRVLADIHTPVSLLQKLNHKTNACFLLESVEGGEQWGRYSFLGISAFGTVQVFQNTVEVVTQDQTKKNWGQEALNSCPSKIEIIPHNQEPLSVIRKIVKSYKPALIPNLPRFWSGLTGYFSYEMVSFFESLPIRLPEGVPYARFIMPERMIIFDNIKQTMTLMHLCYITQDNISSHTPEEIFELANNNIDRLMNLIEQPFKSKLFDQKSLASVKLEPEKILESAFLHNANTIKHHIREGDIFQAVLSLPFSCNVNVDPIMIYRAQRYINPSPYMFFMDFKDLIIAGSSPETMVRLENQVASLRPIAGTRPRGETEQEDRKLSDILLNDEKERAEHIMLIDLGRNDLSRVAIPGSVQVTDTMIVEKYSHVMHLVSNIVCELKQGYDAFDLFRATFPAGTLSGAPKIRAMEIISSLENRPRNIYGGAAGYISFTGNMDLAITIRTAVIEKNLLMVQAGAGIVFDSNPETELEECRNKAKSVEKALQMTLQG